MTSAPFAAGDAAHPEVAEVSAYAEGILPPDESAKVRAHLAECTLCEDVLTSLQDIRAALGSLPIPKMPEDVASRIDAALAAEALLHATSVSRETSADAAAEWDTGAEHTEAETPDDATERSAAAGATHDETPLSSREPTRGGRGVRRTRTAVSRETRRPGNRPPRRGRGPSGPGGRRGRRRALLLGAAGLAGLTLLGGGLFQALDGVSGERTDAPTTQQQAAEAGQLRERVHALLAQQSPHTQSAQPGQSESATIPFRTEGAPRVPGCVREGIDRKETPLAVDEQTFRGTRSFIVVLPNASDPMRVDAYAVDASCTTREGTPGTVLASGTYTRR